MKWPWSRTTTPEPGPPLPDFVDQLHRSRALSGDDCALLAGRYCRVLIDMGIDTRAQVLITNPGSTVRAHAVVRTHIKGTPYYVDPQNALYGYRWRDVWGHVRYEVSPHDLYAGHQYGGGGKLSQNKEDGVAEAEQGGNATPEDG